MSFKDIFKRENGNAIIEYCLVSVIISTAAIVILNAIGPHLINIFDRINQGFS